MVDFESRDISGSHNDGNKPRSFSETALELLRWGRNKFSGNVFESSDACGKEEVKRSFIPKEGNEDNPKRLVAVMDFLVSRMKIDDGGILRREINRLKGFSGDKVSIIPPADKLPPRDALHNLLSGEYDKAIDSGYPKRISDRGQAYTLALYLYRHTSGDSEDEIANTLAQLIAKYDDPRSSIYEHNADGLIAEPYLASMCADIIDKLGIHDSVRSKVDAILSKTIESTERERGERSMDIISEKLGER